MQRSQRKITKNGHKMWKLFLPPQTPQCFCCCGTLPGLSPATAKVRSLNGRVCFHYQKWEKFPNETNEIVVSICAQPLILRAPIGLGWWFCGWVNVGGYERDSFFLNDDIAHRYVYLHRQIESWRSEFLLAWLLMGKLSLQTDQNGKSVGKRIWISYLRLFAINDHCADFQQHFPPLDHLDLCHFPCLFDFCCLSTLPSNLIMIKDVPFVVVGSLRELGQMSRFSR